MSNLSKEEVDRLIKLDKIIYEDIVWQHSHKKVYKFAVEIDIGENYELKLVGTANFLVDKYSYVLLIDGERVRAIDIGEDHHNPDCYYTGEYHFHNSWDEKNKVRYAVALEYKHMTNLEKCLRIFLKECNIILTGNIIWPTDCQMEVLIYGGMSRDKTSD